MRVLITDGHQRTALAAARSLRAAGYDTLVGSPTSPSLAGSSRGIRPVPVSIDPLRDPAGFAQTLARLVEEHKVDLLLPVTDESVEAVLTYRQVFRPDLALPFPDLAIFRRAADKAAMFELAQAAGLGVPESIVIQQPGEALPSGSGLFPAVVKPHRSVAGEGADRTKLGVSFVRTREECAAILSQLPSAAFPVLLQRRIRGPGVGLFALRWNGKILALFSHQRLREDPPAGGASVYRESIALDPQLLQSGTALLERLDWHGVAMIECKRDLDTGRHVLMEINARLWGSLQLAIDAGVDFPALLAAAALKGETPSPQPYRIGVRSRWFWGDLNQLALRMLRSPEQLRLDPDHPSRWRALLDFLAVHPGRDRCEIWRWRDAAPFMVESLTRFGLLSGK